jgi:hypothetical protein
MRSVPRLCASRASGGPPISNRAYLRCFETSFVISNMLT